MTSFSRNLGMLSAFMLSIAASGPAWADPSIAVEAGADLATVYSWRGYVLADAVSLQPSTTLSWNGSPFSLDLWGSVALEDRATWDETDEIDITLDWTRDAAAGDRIWTLSAGYVAYMTPSAETTHMAEMYAGAGIDSPGLPAIEAFYCVDEGSAWYVRPSVGHEWAGSQLAASLGAAAGFSDMDQPFGFHDAEVTAALFWSTGALTLGPTLGLSFARASVNPDDARLWGSFGLHWSSAE